MKLLKLLYTTASTIGITLISFCLPKASSPLTTFVASTPCSSVTHSFLNIPADRPCELMLWKIILHENNKTQKAVYSLECDYGLSLANTPGLTGGGAKVTLTGNWSQLQGTKSNPRAVIYQLHADNPMRKMSFLKLDQNVIHMLDDEQHFMIGNAAWSFTFNGVRDKVK